ncbi:MAG: hypothetical protein K2Y56_21430 [Methylobacterium sp.]|jgi:hypothetical protein|uniref:hypothetical protein n=1 Tax=Methylobacterium sp. TaxID=409 RepID=UPI0025DCBC55|nr:hypothetical protein [Methylobacterium sp.]MBX9934046.1 hypothetical protein [Methylobacterium sp.]
MILLSDLQPWFGTHGTFPTKSMRVTVAVVRAFDCPSAEPRTDSKKIEGKKILNQKEKPIGEGFFLMRVRA